MEERTLRTIGASVVLIGIVIAGIVQVSSGESPASPQVVAPSTDSDNRQVAMTHSTPSTSVDEPFVYRIGVLAGIDTDNFWTFYGQRPSVWNSYILGLTKPALYSVNHESGALEPELIAADVTPTWNSDGWRVVLDLSDGFSWSDGTPITAEDLVFTFETVRALGLGGSWAQAFPDEVASIAADGEFRVRIEFTERPDLTVWPYGVGQAPVMPRHVWEPLVAGATVESLYQMEAGADVSGGPLTLVSTSESLVVSNVNPGYPLGSAPDSVEYHVYPDEATLIQAVAAGEVDTVLSPKGLTREQLATVADAPGVSVVASPANGVRYLGFNLTRAPMSDTAFREALALLIDRESLASSIPHTGDAAWSMLPAANTQWYEPARAEQNAGRFAGSLSDRLGRALESLRAAGYAWSTEPAVDGSGKLVPGTGLTIGGVPPQPLTILTPGDAYDPARADYVGRIADTLQSLGFDARPVETDFDTVVEIAFTPAEDGVLHYDMYVLGWTLGNPALPSFYRPFFGADGEMNNTGYSSDAFNDALDRYEAAHSTMEAKEALWSMEQTLAADLPYLVLYTSQLNEIFRSDRVDFDIAASLGGLQGRLGGIGDVRPAG